MHNERGPTPNPEQPQAQPQVRRKEQRSGARADNQGQSQRQQREQRPPRKRTDQQTDRPRNNKQRTPNKKNKARPPRITNHWFRAIVMVAATVVGCIFLSFFVIRSLSDLFGLNQPNYNYDVVIPEGTEIKDVADILGKVGVVDTPLTFRLYMSYKEKEPVINAGEYQFNSEMAYDEIIIMLKTVDITQSEVRIQIFDHFSLEDIASELKKEGIIEDGQDFLKYLNETEFEYDFLKDIPDDPLRYHKYEGYFYPDTYDFFIGERYDSIATKFFSNFGRKMTEDYAYQMEKRNMTLDETLILASVIQREAGVMKDMVRVSSVFHNRLDNPTNFPRLESDVTLLYAEENIKPYLTGEGSQDVYDAYNTYVRKGLPVGPICNPGAEAIYAALNPITTNYYYFVTDVKQNFYYATTLAEHEQKTEEAKKVDESGEGIVHGISTKDPATAE